MLQINFVEGEKAFDILANSDSYYKIMTPNERALRMGIDHNPDKPISEEEFGNYVKQHICEFKSSDKEIITDIIGRITKCLQDNNFIGCFPVVVNVILTDGLEDIREFTGYSRKNTICINKRGIINGHLTLFVRKLFHIFSQNNPGLRNMLYKSIGFEKCNDIVLPTDLTPKLITIPDAQLHDVFIKVKLKTKTKQDSKQTDVVLESKSKKQKVSYDCEEIKVTPVLFYDKDNGYSFFQRLYIRLLRIEAKTKSHTSENIEYTYYVNDEKKYEMYDVEDVDNFWSQVGECRYYFHPDEILATRFAIYVVSNILYNSWQITPRNIKEERVKEMVEILFNRQS